MNASPDRELQQWIDSWRAEPVIDVPEAVRRHVRRRTRLITAWLCADVAVAITALVFLGSMVQTVADPVDRMAFVLLAGIAAGALALSWWNWRGTVRPAGDTTAAFVAIAVERTRRFRRALILGWVLLLTELGVLVPWIRYRLQSPDRSSPEAQQFAWGLLLALTLIALGFLVLLHWWNRREARALDAMRCELEI